MEWLVPFPFYLAREDLIDEVAIITVHLIGSDSDDGA